MVRSPKIKSHPIWIAFWASNSSSSHSQDANRSRVNPCSPQLFFETIIKIIQVIGGWDNKLSIGRRGIKLKKNSRLAWAVVVILLSSLF